MSDPDWLDGNALAGTFHQWFGTEMTDAPRGCQTCGAIRPVGAHRLYRGAGLVLRCPVCADVALQITALPDRQVVRLIGTWCFEIASFPDPPEAARRTEDTA
jgi:hypothetical protein